MRRLLALLLCFSLKSFACGEEGKEFSPFAIEFESQRNSQLELKVFEILSPIKKGDEFLSSITARLEGEFEVNLDIREDFSYIGDYYRSYISVANKHSDKIEIILDGGIRRGTHVIKALSLGATACSGGRMYLYALAAGGQKGVEKAMGNLRNEIERDMKLMGVTNVDQLSRKNIKFR